MRKNNNRVAIIECCWHCPHHVHDDQRDEFKWGKSWCEKMDAEVFEAEEIIDERCPLPFAHLINQVSKS